MLALSALLLCTACKRAAPPESAAVTLRFLDGAVLVEAANSKDLPRIQGPGAAQARLLATDPDHPEQRADAGALGDGSQLYLFDWQAGAEYRVGTTTATAPMIPEMIRIAELPLDDADRPMADTALAFSPDARRLAVGEFGGKLRVFDPFTGAPDWEQRVAEGFAKRLAFSPDGAVLYVGAQSPSGRLRALDAGSGEERWRVELSEHVEPSNLPPGNDRYGIYELPAVQRLIVLDNGDLVVAASHAWTLPDGERKNLGRILRYAPDGSLRAAWPPDGPLHLAVPALTASADGRLVAFGCSLSAEPKAGEQHEPGGVYLLETRESPAGALQFALRWGGAPEPVEPYPTAVLWSALALSADGGRLMAGWADGRARVWDSSAPGPGLPDPLHAAEPGLPLSIEGIPVGTGVGFGARFSSGFAYQTTLSLVPWQARTAASSPPAPHPRADTLWLRDRDGAPRWSHRGPWSLGGLVALDLPDGGSRIWSLAGSRPDERKDLFGVLAYSAAPAAGGAAPQPAFHRMAGPPFFEAAAVHSDIGPLLAVVETTERDDAGRVTGSYRVLVLR